MDPLGQLHRVNGDLNDNSLDNLRVVIPKLSPADLLLMRQMQKRDFFREQRKEMIDKFAKRMSDDLGIEHTIDVEAEVVTPKRLQP